MVTPATWTAPFHGVQHLVQDGKKTISGASWASVTDRGTWADSTFWPLGAGFSRAITLHHDSVSQARSACEAWLSAQYG